MPSPLPLIHEEEACVVFSEVVEKLLKKANELPQNLSKPQLLAMNYVDQHPGTSARQLAEGLAISAPAATQIVDRLVKKNLLHRKEAEKDRRATALSLSAQGQQLLKQARQEKRKPLEDILQSMPPKQREDLFRGLSSFIFLALKDEGSAEHICDHCWMEHFGDCLINQVHRKLTGRDVKRALESTSAS